MSIVLAFDSIDNMKIRLSLLGKGSVLALLLYQRRFISDISIGLTLHYCAPRSGLNRCRAPGVKDMKLPFTCPLDYVFNPGDFEDAGRQHGPKIDVRDHSFFDHPGLPKKLKVTRFNFVNNLPPHQGAL